LISPTWKVAAVQMDCRLGNTQSNLQAIRQRLRAAADGGARLVAFPECALTGYCFESKQEAWPHTEPLRGPSMNVVADDCRSLGVWAVIGFLERDDASGQFFNAAAVVGPAGIAGSYRKIHLPCLGVDRFVAPGDRPFEVQDLGGLRVGINICYDGSFPESSRVLTLLGADLVVLPTNWPTGARSTVKYLVQARALENHIYYLAVNRTGEERGFQFLGQSRIVNWDGELLASSEGRSEEILYAELDPEAARQKQVVKIPGKYEINRVDHRRPEMYGPLCATPGR
jgi:predicted amidohydrolase